MCKMKLWATKNASGTTSLFRGDIAPEIDGGFYYNSDSTKALCFRDSISDLAGKDLHNGQCREIKSIDLINWTVEYVPDPPTLKEAWEEYRMLNRQSLSCCGTARDLFDALQREFPDE